MYSCVPPVLDTGREESGSKRNSPEAPACRSHNSSSGTKKSHVSESILKRFEALKKRTDDVTKRSTEKRLKHLQKTVIDKVVEEFKHPEDLDELMKHDVKFGPPIKSERKGDNSIKPDEQKSEEKSTISKKEWSEVKQYLTINDHVVTTSGQSHSKSGLEKQIDCAIKTGDIGTAEKLSDSLATRDFGAKIANAIDARDFLKRKREEANTAKMKKKKKLAWGFEHKQRWETKSNM